MLSLMLIYQVIAGLSLLKVANAVDVPDPIAHFPLNSKYETRESNNLQLLGTPVGVSLAPGPNNKTGGSYQFTGQKNSYIEFPNDGGLDVQRSITVLCWVNYAGSGTNYQVIAGYLNVKQEDVGFAVVLYKGILTVIMKDRAGEIAWSDTQPLESGAWHFVGASYDDDTGIVRLYVDDKIVAEKNMTANAGAAATEQFKLYVGGFPVTSSSSNFNGRIANLWIFDVALTLDQINAVQFPVEAPTDECSCYNGGSCAPRDDGYMCICPAGYIGEHCEWQKQGCYHEVWPRKSKAMGELIGKFKENRKDVQAAVEACLKAAQEKQLEIFGVSGRYKCVTTKKDSPADFDRYGSSVTCKEEGDYGVGLKRENFVYILKKGE